MEQQKEKQSTKKTAIAGALVITAIVILMLTYLVYSCDYRSIIRAIYGADLKFVFVGILCVCFFICCESVNIGRAVRVLGHKGSFWQFLKYGTAGFFFSNITPSASGGQPMQLYYMHKDGIEVSRGSLALLIELMGFQIANISLAIIGIICNFTYILSLDMGTKVLLMLGLAANCVVLIALLLLLFLPSAANFAGDRMKMLCLKFNKKNAIKKITGQINDYKESSIYIRKNPKLLAKIIVTAIFQLTALYSVTYCVYAALGCNGANWLEIFSLQAVLSAGVSVVPIPGTAGAAEGGFRLIFAAVFGNLVLPGMVLSRGLSFYIAILITGAFLLASLLRNKYKKYDIMNPR